jgi:hypothetical protein
MELKDRKRLIAINEMLFVVLFGFGSDVLGNQENRCYHRSCGHYDGCQVYNNYNRRRPLHVVFLDLSP